MLKRSRLALALSFSVAVLCGCGGAAESAQPTPATSTTAVKDKKHRFESVKADCMKRQGFKYVAYVKPEEQETEQDRKVASGDYEAMRKHREKYGFGVFSMFVYPKELRAPEHMGGEAVQDPNIKIQTSLSPAQDTAYRKAKDTCVAQAGKQVLGLTLKSNMDYFNSVTLAHRQAKTRELDGDAELAELAGVMASCLKGKGDTVGETKPTVMARLGEDRFMFELDKIGRRQDDKVPDVAPPRKPGKGMQLHMPDLTPQDARPYLGKEIKAALDDLECGKDFYAIYQPRVSALQQQINDRYAF
ncbi:hypothetical protein [Nonomuraea sp. NPDC050643]|uniref:hypothetical protein n=1 Tax=Nonomuraea sp. NPDC050643 TaxID=3155660 RepID=UPI0033D2767B